MIKTMAKSIREFKRPTIITLVLIVLEVFVDVLIPFYTADLVNAVKAGAAMDGVVRIGLILVASLLRIVQQKRAGTRAKAEERRRKAQTLQEQTAQEQSKPQEEEETHG